MTRRGHKHAPKRKGKIKTIEAGIAVFEPGPGARRRNPPQPQPKADAGPKATEAWLDLRGKVAAQEAALDASQKNAPWDPNPDDRGYKPKRVDPIRVGAARATGTAAVAAMKHKTFTKFEHDERERGR